MCVGRVTPLSFTIPGEPVPKGRPRVANGHAYTPERTRTATEAAQWAMKRAMKGKRPLTDDVALTLDFQGGKAMLRADIDNLAKLVMDAGNGILWEDDRQVKVLVACKRFSTEKSTAVIVADMNDEATEGGPLD